MKKEKEKKLPPLEEPDKPIFSDKKNVLRLIGFLIAFVIAVTFITIGVVQIGHKDPGLYEVEADADSSLPLYASGIHLKYYFTGSSNEIKAEMNSLKSVYAEALKLSYQWFDAKNTYPETPNLAEISKNPGKAIKLQEPLFRVLEEALEKTELNEGYTIFAAPRIALENSVLYANEPALLDPMNSEDTAAFLAELEQAIRDPGELILNKTDLTATLNLSAAYAAFLETSEMAEEGVLHLGILADAYRLQYLAQKLEEKGFTKGFLTTDSGISLLLSGYSNEQAKFCLYSLDQEGEVEVSATKTARSGEAACSFRVFAFEEGETGFYTVAEGDRVLYRNPYQSEFPETQPVMSILAVAENGDVVGATYTCLCMMHATDAETALSIAEKSTLFRIVDLNDGAAKLYLSGAGGVETVAGYEQIFD